MESIFFFILMVTAIIAATELVRWGIKAANSHSFKGEAMAMLPLKGHVEDVEGQIRELKDCWSSNILILDMGMDSETREICYRLESDFSEIAVETPGSLMGRINSSVVKSAE